MNLLKKALFGSAFVAGAAFAIAGTVPAQAQVTGPPGTNAAGHPAYLHALADLRRAHHDIAVKGLDGDTKHPHDKACLQHIEDAINDIKQAGVDDGKPMEDRIPGDPVDHVGRLHRAERDLKHALKDATEEETNKSKLLGHNSPLHLQKRASVDIKLAISEVKLALQFAKSEK
jgi:hypothetical protein